MSIQVDSVRDVTGVLIAGVWLGVDVGTLDRRDPVHGSSGSTAVFYRWSFEGHRYQAMAADIIAVQMVMSS